MSIVYGCVPQTGVHILRHKTPFSLVADLHRKKVARDNSMVIGYGKRQLNGDWLRRKTAQW